ncbi:MAG: hypothetical protein R6X12_00300 [bacterium]
MNAVDPVVLLIVALAAYAEYSHGLFFALNDIVRGAAALGAALVGYTVAARLVENSAVGLVVGAALAAGVLGLAALLLKRLGEGPAWNKTLASRLAAAVVGVPLGVAICFFLLPVASRLGPVGAAVDGSYAGRWLLDRLPAFYEMVDVLNVQVPRFDGREPRFEDESSTGTSLTGRVNFRRLAGATCIECRSPVEYKGYRRSAGSEVSPLFSCPGCGRRSDGCQTFEGFHAMYQHCPHDVSAGGFDLDCGVWPNDRPVRPAGSCPVCGRGAD